MCEKKLGCIHRSMVTLPLSVAATALIHYDLACSSRHRNVYIDQSIPSSVGSSDNLCYYPLEGN